jgi:hypothetical protein
MTLLDIFQIVFVLAVFIIGVGGFIYVMKKDLFR